MDLYVVGTIISVALILLSGIVLVIGLSFYKREKSAGNIRTQLLIYSLAAFAWSFCYGCLGFLNNVHSAQIFRMIGVTGIDIFLVADFCVVMDLTHIREKLARITKIVTGIIFAIDWGLFSQPEVDSFFFSNGYMTWKGNACFARTYHNVVISILFIIMASMGIYAYRIAELKRQKRFVLCFYVANVCLLALCSADTIFVSKHALPTSGLGAVLCTFILWAGTLKYSTFDISVANLFNQIYDAINVGILVFDDKQKIIYSNPYCTRILGEKDNKGKKLSDYFDINDARIDRLFSSVKYNELSDFTIHAKNVDAECTSRLSCVVDMYNEPYCYLMVVNDITDMIHMMDELKRANSAKSNFLTSMSHEIRTPINSVLGMNEMILRECKEENILAYANNIGNSGRLLLSIINDILDFSKIESGKMQLFETNYDLSSIINDLYVFVNQRAEEKGLDLIINVNPDTPSWLFGDEVRINQIVLNILTNAIKYTDVGFVSLECDYEIVDEDNINLLFSVRDSGRGIKNVDTDSLFQSFTRLDEIKNRSIEGTGLGLAITKAFLDMMKGNVSVESIYGVGSRFTVSIPQKISNHTPVGKFDERYLKTKNDALNYTESFKAPAGRILAVDDVDMNLSLIKGLLKKTELTIDCVTSGDLAIKKCRETQYHAILMDHMMPGMDGLECMKRIRSDNGKNTNTPIIVLTANAVVGMRDKYIEDGFDNYLSKPVDSIKLEEMIRSYLPEEIVITNNSK